MSADESLSPDQFGKQDNAAARKAAHARVYTLDLMHRLVGDTKVDPDNDRSPWTISDEDIPSHTEAILQEHDRPDRVRAAEVVLAQHAAGDLQVLNKANKPRT